MTDAKLNVDDCFAVSGISLLPLDAVSRELAVRAKTYVAEMITKAKAFTDEMNRTLHSEFNPHDLYSGVCHSTRCRENGATDAEGRYYKGVELVMSSSMGEVRDVVTISPIAESGKFLVRFGKAVSSDSRGLLVNTQDEYNRFRLEKQIVKAMQKKGFAAGTRPHSQTETILDVSAETSTVDEALTAAENMVREYLFRVGIEANMYNLIKQRRNVVEITDANMADFIRMADEPRDGYRSIMIITTTRVCRRCKAEWNDIVNLTKQYSDAQFGIAFTDKPKLKFIPKVFEQDCGGVRNTGKVTPFIVFYHEGQFQIYYATRQEEPPPSVELMEAGIKKYIFGAADKCG